MFWRRLFEEHDVGRVESDEPGDRASAETWASFERTSARVLPAFFAVQPERETVRVAFSHVVQFEIFAVLVPWKHISPSEGAT